MARGVAARTERFTESVIREMTRLIMVHHPTDGINLAQGFPDFAAPQVLKDAACQAIQDDLNQYAVTWGAPEVRQAIARKYARFYDLAVDPEREVTVCCGATESMLATLLATTNPGDEVIILTPYYENYWPDSVLAGATPRFVPLCEPPLTCDEWASGTATGRRPPAPGPVTECGAPPAGAGSRGPEGGPSGQPWALDLDALAGAFNERTAAIIINTPNNPTGKVFSRAEMGAIADLCQRWDTLAITDEIYEHIVYHGEHVVMATLPGMRERTVTISGISKSYSVTGWRVGWAIAPERISNAIRKVHDFLTVGAAAPLQAAAAVALGLPDDYYRHLVADYTHKRQLLLHGLARAGFSFAPPEGAYYVMADITPFGFADDVAFARHLVEALGVAVVPGTSFYPHGAGGQNRVRFSFPKKHETLRRAGERLARLPRP